MNYWIIENGVTVGPISGEELAARALPGNTPVWRAGLPDWTYLDSLPEREQLQGTASMQESAQQTTHSSVGRNVGRDSHPWKAPVSYSGQQGRPANTYLGWSILATVACCTLFGIVAVVYSLRVRDENNRGYFAEARHDSRIVELWLMASIAFGLAAMPFNIIISML